MTPVIEATSYRVPSDRPVSLRLIGGLERVAAGFAVALLLPLYASVAVVIALLSKRGPLVSHSRVGLGGEPLRMLKFRTMWDAPASAGLFTVEKVSGTVPPCKEGADARVNSRFAAFCRRHSVDELPQLYHVMRGEMSLVGPRPITRQELEVHYAGCMEEVLSVRPGMTGLWQVMGRNHLTYARRRRLDLIFVRRASAGLYFRIILRSVPRVLSGTGAF